MKYLTISSAVFMAGVCCRQAEAAAEVFTIDNSQSSVEIASGSVFAYFAITPQGTGALSTSYSGSINVNLSGSTIQFPGGSAVNARTNGVWQPAVGGASGSAPADYGPEAQVFIQPFGFYPFYVAMRNFSFDVTSATLPFDGTNFDGTNLIFSVASVNAAADYYSSVRSGSVALSGYATTNLATGAMLTTNGTTQTLIIPIGAQFSFTVFMADDTKINLSGQIVATNSITATRPFIDSIDVTNQNVVVTAENATTLSQLLVSTNLTAWTPAIGVVIATNDLGQIIFTAPVNGTSAFFQVRQ